MNKKTYISPAIEIEAVVNNDMICSSITGTIESGTTDTSYSKGDAFSLDNFETPLNGVDE